MDSKDYYYNYFRPEFDSFVSKTNIHEHTGEGLYISIQEINEKSLEHIPAAHKMLFLAALSCTVLVDQVMYTYFKRDYPSFQQMTQYPKFEYGITNVNVNPWHLYRRAGGLTIFERFARFFITDLEKFFTDHQFIEASWEKVSQAMLIDKDIAHGAPGGIFIKLLTQHSKQY